MTLPLTPETIRASYDYFCTTPPFNEWNLPDGDDVVFRVGKDRRCFGWYDRKNNKHRITISSGRVGRTHMLNETVAHEMAHLYLGITGMERGGEHNAAFNAVAEEICRVHGFDPKVF